MEAFKGLHTALGKPEKQEFPPDSFIEKEAENFDENLIELWQADGWACYGDGLFWTVNPKDFTDIVKDWKIVKPKSIVFGRNAFGDLFLLKNEEVFMLSIQQNDLGSLGPDVYIFLNSTLKETSLRESFLQKKLFEKVRKKLGELESDECYGLFPALPLGGDEDDADAYKHVKLREYLSSLAQMHD